MPKILQSKKKTIGLRIPNNKIALSIIETLGHPILSASFPGENVEDYTDPEIIYENWLGRQGQLEAEKGRIGLASDDEVDGSSPN